jgi:hypothetical protein
MNIEQFAEQHNLAIRRDDCGDVMIQGKAGSLSQGSGGLLSLTLMFETPRKWNASRRELQEAGFVLRQDGDTEGVLTFDPTDRKQSRLAIKAPLFVSPGC